MKPRKTKMRAARIIRYDKDARYMRILSERAFIMLVLALSMTLALAGCGTGARGGTGGLGTVTVYSGGGGNGSGSGGNGEDSSSGENGGDSNSGQGRKDPYGAGGTENGQQPPVGNDAYLLDIQWEWHSNNYRLNLYFNSKGEFTEESVFSDVNYVNAGGMVTTYKSGSLQEFVFKGTYKISGDMLTFTYESAKKRANSSYQWEGIDLPGITTVPYRIVLDEEIFTGTGSYRDIVHIEGVLPPYGEMLNGDETRLWANYVYTGPIMGYLDPDASAGYDYGNSTVALPYREWPTALFPDGVPAYGQGGIRGIMSGSVARRSIAASDGSRINVDANTATVIIEGASQADVMAYIDELLRSGWLLRTPADMNDIGEYLGSGEDCLFESSRQDDLEITIYRNGLVFIEGYTMIQ